MTLWLFLFGVLNQKFNGVNVILSVATLVPMKTKDKALPFQDRESFQQVSLSQAGDFPYRFKRWVTGPMLIVSV